jgi:hypothetical protein
MNHINKINAIQFIKPNAEFVLRGDEVEWLDKKQTEPTNAQIEAAWADYQAAQAAQAEAKAQAKAAAQAKLAALGLTVEDLQALGL